MYRAINYQSKHITLPTSQELLPTFPIPSSKKFKIEFQWYVDEKSKVPPLHPPPTRAKHRWPSNAPHPSNELEHPILYFIGSHFNHYIKMVTITDNKHKSEDEFPLSPLLPQLTQMINKHMLKMPQCKIVL